MPFGFFAREWERTCTECGYTWRVPRSIARRGVRGTSAMPFFGGAAAARRSPSGNAGLMTGLAAHAETMEAFRICARCGVDHYTQRPVRRGS